jgi:hypothetical protein
MLVRSIGRTAAIATLFSLAVAAGLTSLSTAALGATEPDPDPVVEQPFAAHSGDFCLYGQVKGALGWHLPPIGGPPNAVDVSGVLTDKPTAPITTPECADDRRFTVVTLSAYTGGFPIDTEVIRADNSMRRFAVQLTNETRRAPIELVVVQVCRQSFQSGTFDYCGARQVYRAPVSL